MDRHFNGRGHREYQGVFKMRFERILLALIFLYLAAAFSMLWYVATR